MFLDRFLGRVKFVADEPVGDVDVHLQVFCRCVLLQDGADGDAELRVLGQFGGPVLEAIDVGEGDVRPCNTSSRSLIQDLPPVASQRY